MVWLVVCATWQGLVALLAMYVDDVGGGASVSHLVLFVEVALHWSSWYGRRCGSVAGGSYARGLVLTGEAHAKYLLIPLHTTCSAQINYTQQYAGVMT